MKNRHKSEGGHNPHADSQQCGEVKVHGSIQVFNTQDAIEQHNAEHRDDKTYRDAAQLHDKAIRFWTSFAAIVTTLYFGATCFIFWESKKAADAARDSVRIADTSLKVSQRAYVSIGRKDGVVADFVIPKDPKQDAEIVIYFQNSGHLAAKFAWGTMIGFLAEGSKKNSTGIRFTHPFKGPLIRTRDRKNGGINEYGESSVIAGDSIFVGTLGVISRENLAALPANKMGVFILGEYGYCDELGTFTNRQFGLNYRSNAPTSSLSFALAQETDFPTPPLPKPTDTTEYLPPCKTLDEK